MNNFTRFLIRHKFAAVNLVFFLIVSSIPISSFSKWKGNEDFFFTLGCLLFAGIFLEIGATHYKAALIFSREEIREAKIPWYLRITFFPRLLVSFGLAMLLSKGLGWLSKSDFILIILVLYAAGFEFWVRASLLNPEYGESNQVGIVKNWMGEIFHMLYLLFAYYAIWYLMIFDSGMLMNKIRYTQNYPLLAFGFFFVFTTLQLPYFVEEYFKPRGNRGRITGFISLAFPVIAFIFHLFQALAAMPPRNY